MLRKIFSLALAVALLTVVQWSCHGVLMTAPPNSTITMFANPTSVPAFGGVSIITAIVTEPSGLPVSDGTVVQFFADRGQVEALGKTVDGVTRVKFVSDSRSGKATITGVSGGPAQAAPSGSASATATPPATPTVAVAAVSDVAAVAASSGVGSATAEVMVGNANATKVLVRANPPRILVTDPRQSSIVATASDADGNPAPNVPILFTVSEDAAGLQPAKFESLASAGNPVYTDNNGRAYDTLHTTYGLNQNPKWVVVTAQALGGSGRDQVTIQIN